MQKASEVTKHEKLLEKLLRLPKDFTYDELCTLLIKLGYSKAERGRTSGSAVMFYNSKSQDKIMFDRPHPKKELKRYILKLVIDHLKENNFV